MQKTYVLVQGYDFHFLAIIESLQIASQRRTSGMENELEMLQRLRHPNIIQLIGVYDETFFVLELMEGGSLEEAIHSEAISTEWNHFVKCVSVDILRALVFLHNLKIPVAHLDLKSGNVLLNQSRDSAKLCDFGFAQALEQGDIYLEGVRGTPAWISPEVLAKQKVGVKTDIYGFGLIVWEMMERKRPYEGLNVDEV